MVDADIVIEAVFEDADVKRALWADLDRQAPAAAIFASNTSSISIDSLAGAVTPERRQRFVTRAQNNNGLCPYGVLRKVAASATQ